MKKETIIKSQVSRQLISLITEMSIVFEVPPPHGDMLSFFQVTCEHNKTVGASDGITIHVGDQCFAGILNGDVPLLINVFGIPLTSPVSLTSNIIMSTSTSQSPSSLLQSLNGAAVTSISTGTSGSAAVIVASVAGTVDQPPAPLRFVQL